MNSKLLNEIVHRNVKKVLNEAMSENFSFDTLKSIPSFRGRLK